MARIAARPCSVPAKRSTGSPSAGLRGRSKDGQPSPTGPPLSPRAPLPGSSGRPAARRVRARPSGGSIALAGASRIPSCASAAKPAAPVRPGRCAREPRRPGAAGLFRRRNAVTRSRRPGPGMPGRRGDNTPNVGQGSKGRSPTGGGPVAGGAPGFGAWPRPAYRPGPPRPRSLSLGLSPGWRNGHGPRPGPRAVRPWRRGTTSHQSPRDLSSAPMLRRAHTPLPDFCARCRQRMAICYDNICFCRVSSREARQEGALVYYERMTNSIRAVNRYILRHIAWR